MRKTVRRNVHEREILVLYAGGNHWNSGISGWKQGAFGYAQLPISNAPTMAEVNPA